MALMNTTRTMSDDHRRRPGGERAVVATENPALWLMDLRCTAKQYQYMHDCIECARGAPHGT